MTAFEAGRNEAAGDECGFQKTKVVGTKVEDFIDSRDVGSGFEVDAYEAENGLVDDTQEGFDWRRWAMLAATVCEVDRDVD